MRNSQNNLVLSRYFCGNVQFVADMCPKCYEESEDVRIISVNVRFLKRLDNNFYKCITEDFLGFTDEEMEESEGRFENIENCLNENKELFKKSEEKCNTSKIQSYKTVIKNDNLQTEVKKSGSDHDKFDSTKQEDSQMNEKNKNLEKIPESRQTQFISNFLITDFEEKYFEKRKTRDRPQLSQSWTPPSSPHNLLEECLYSDPWALLIATIFLNKTSCLVARPYVFWFLADNPDPLTVLDKFPNDFEKYFHNLGLVKTRAIQVYRMSYDFLFKEWKNVRQLYGIGHYGECAYRMFCLGDFSVEPKDRFLKIYKAWHQQCHKSQYS